MIDPLAQDQLFRLSVTDRCDLRCRYCMPERMTFLPRAEMLSLAELDRLAAAFVRKGVRKLRLTGGEPLCAATSSIWSAPRALPARGRARRADADHQRHQAGRACRRAGAMRRPEGQCLARQSRSETYARITRAPARSGRGRIDAALAAGIEVSSTRSRCATTILDELVGLAEWAHARAMTLT